MRGSVNYDANDRFCMDGQRLIVTSGTYGADGSEYRTEIESSRASSHTAPRATARPGSRSRPSPGRSCSSATARIHACWRKTTARDWALNKVADTKNNYFTVTYTNDTTNGQAYPNRIDYTANDGAGLAAYNSVRFVYASRPDIVPTYQAGSLRQITVRLTNVQTYAGASMVADYRLAYAQGSSTNRSQLTSVTLCDGSGANCLPATTFTWQNGTTNVSVTSNVASQNGTLAGYRPYVGDFNGDGIADVMWDAEYASWPISSGTRVLWTGTGTSFTVTSNFAGRNGQLFGYTPMIADFNRDGRSDVWWYSGGVDGTALATSQWFSTSSGTFTVTPGRHPR